MRLYTALCVLLCTVTGGIGQPAGDYLTKRERWGQSQTFEWEMNIQDEFSASLYAELHQLPVEVQAQIKGQADMRKHRTLSHLIVRRSPPNDWVKYEVRQSTRYPQEKFFFLLGEKFLVCLLSMGYSQGNSIKTLYVIPTPSKAIYSGIPPYHSGIGSHITAFHPAFLAAAHPLKAFSPLAWTGYDYQQFQWIKKGNDLFVVPLAGEALIMLRLSVKHGYAPAALTVREANSLHNWKVLEWKRVDNLWIPSLVHYEYRGRNIRTKARLRLIKVKPTSGNSVSLPLGATVVDFRLQEKFLDSPQRSKEGVVTYTYSGSFPSRAQLKQLAYQQGNLLPPETPRRRYSLWMFLPAIALFGLALLLYLRRKR